MSIAARRPFMTVAVCAVTSAATPGIQDRLHQAIRFLLSAKAIVNGERSMDLLLGLLVYIAWHHHYLMRHQIDQLTCLLAGMATDLGFYERSNRSNTEEMTTTVERDRALLGCYYLCSCLSMKGFNKPNTLRWTNDFRLYAESVASAARLPSDQELVAITEMAHVLDDLNDTLQTETDLKPPTLDKFVEMQEKAANLRIKDLKRAHPSLGGNMMFAAATIDVHQKLVAANADPNTTALIQCACSIKDYLDEILGRPPIMMHQLAIVDWTNLLNILILMARVSISLSKAVGWEADTSSSMLPPEKILGTISAHMDNAPQGDALAPRNESLVRWFKSFCGSIKRSIELDQLDHDGNRRFANEVPYGASPQPPYANPVSLGSIRTFRDGVLEQSFLDTFMKTP